MDLCLKELVIIVKVVMIKLYRSLWIMIVRKIIINSSNNGSKSNKYRSIILK